MENQIHFTQKLIDWYRNHYRKLPWRQNATPYYIWISEIILQQTQVSYGVPYYTTFIERFPTIEDLAEASEQEILAVWQGLGYYRRAINLHKTAKIISSHHRGIFPSTYDQLIKLPGIGDYTASAILSICFGKPYGVVDGNVYRFFARYFGIDMPLGSSLAFKTFKKLSNHYLDIDHPDLYNQAIMEYGALVCTYQNPRCHRCVFQNNCYAFNAKQIDQFPVKKSKKLNKIRYFNFLVIQPSDGLIVLEKRKKRDIWAGLYQFPLIESNKELQTVEQLISEKGSHGSFMTDHNNIKKWNEKAIMQRLSHQRLWITFWIIPFCNQSLKNTYPIEQLSTVPLPMILSNFVKRYF
ncbi:MAG: A/G-specific adenine glycosylase [Flavobacteriaceae bacterium]|nr:A/G-specific adenine glycosylase [Flavobacteriaceae bacterium]